MARHTVFFVIAAVAAGFWVWIVSSPEDSRRDMRQVVGDVWVEVLADGALNVYEKRPTGAYSQIAVGLQEIADEGGSMAAERIVARTPSNSVVAVWARSLSAEEYASADALNASYPGFPTVASASFTQASEWARRHAKQPALQWTEPSFLLFAASMLTPLVLPAFRLALTVAVVIAGAVSTLGAFNFFFLNHNYGITSLANGVLSVVLAVALTKWLIERNAKLHR